MSTSSTAAASHLVAARAARPNRLTVVSPTEQPLIGPEVDQVCQPLAALRTREAGGMPKGAVVTCSLGVNGWALHGNLTVATGASLEDREGTECEAKRPRTKLLGQILCFLDPQDIWFK